MPRQYPSPNPSLAATLGLAVAAPGIAAPAGAQPAAPGLDSGAVVRVRASAVGLRGAQLTVTARRGDTLVLRGARDGAGWVVPLSGVERLEVRGERRPRGEAAGHGALVGLAFGVVPTLALLPLAIQADRHCDDCFISATAVLGVLGTGLTVVTTAAGAIIGYTTPRYRWEGIAPGRLRVGAAPTPSGGVVAVRWAF